MDAESLLRRVADAVGGVAPSEPDRIVAVRVLAARNPATEPLPDDLPELLVGRLQLAGITRLFGHQAAALRHVRSGRHVVVATGTASGKSLCYQVPILERALRDSSSTALYMAPTKALARDQLRQLRAFRIPHARAAVYDGDTPRADREAVRRTANVLLTNPDMLHVGILPGHRRWATFLSRLDVVAIDECHVARGVFGSHVAAVLRRLLRLADHYGAQPTFVLSSATIGNPGEHARALTGLDVAEVTQDTSGAPRRALALWSPPQRPAAPRPQTPTGLPGGRRRSTLSETADVLAELVRQGAATLAFVKSRKAAEVIAVAARRRLGHDADRLKVMAYRAGLLPEERRRVERGLVDGTLRGVAATDALELGVDVGGLDAVVISGWPGTAASWWQQAGRAGRRDREAAVVFIAEDDPLDRYLLDHPDELFTRPLEHAVTDLTNIHVAAGHLRCAAAELPVGADEPRLLPMDVAVLADAAVEAGHLRPRGGRLYPAGAGSPAASISLRTAAGGSIDIIEADTGVVIGEVDLARAPSTVHAGAVYLHQGRPWRVRTLDLDRAQALVDADDGTTATTARSETDIGIRSSRASRRWGRCTLSFGDVEVTTHVHSYERHEVFSPVSLGVTELDLPPQRLQTKALWLTLPGDVLSGLTPQAIPGAAHAAEHAAIGLLPLFAMCDRWDIGGVSTAQHRDTGATTIFIYDAYPGGAGVAERGFATDDGLWRTTCAAIAGCTCDDGCPSCVQSPKCGNGNQPLDKHGAVTLLRIALSQHDRDH